MQCKRSFSELRYLCPVGFKHYHAGFWVNSFQAHSLMVFPVTRTRGHHKLFKGQYN